MGSEVEEEGAGADSGLEDLPLRVPPPEPCVGGSVRRVFGRVVLLCASVPRCPVSALTTDGG